MPKALEGIDVLDLSRTIAGAWCARLLADAGAEVTMRDPHPVRTLAPFNAHGVSVPARYVLANRRSVMMDQADPRWAERFARADVIIDTAGAGSEDRRWVDSLAAGTPSAVHAIITPHGLSGERARWPGNEMTADALSGWASVNGLADREPLKASGYQAAYQSGTLAFGAVLCALAHRLRGGPGQRIDVATDEVLAVTFAPGVLRSQYQGKAWPRRDEVDFLTGPVAVEDGHFALTLTRKHFWVGAMELLGLDDLAVDEALHTSESRNSRKERFVPRVEQTLRGWTKSELFAGLSARHIVAGPAFTMDEIADCEQLAAREFFTTVDGVRYPGPPMVLSRTPLALEHGLRAPGADTDRMPAPRGATVGHVDGAAPGDRPLSGYRGVVLTQAWAGTLATQLLGLMGAEVIQVEARSRFDSWRGQPDTPMPAALQELATAQHTWNCNGLFNSVNLEKLSVTLELDTPEGLETFKRLVAQADFTAENFSPNVKRKLGFAYEDLRAVKSDLVMLSISGFGQTGPWSAYPAIGGTIEPASGMSALLGYDGGAPMNSGQMYPDAVAGLYGFAGIALALYHRERTGEGQYIDLSMQEANLSFVGDAWMEFATTGAIPRPRGNSHRSFAPHGIYPCAGEGRWIAIAAETDAQFAALARVAGRTEWTARFPDLESRRSPALDEAIAAWSRLEERDELAGRLAEAGVIAAPVHDALGVAHDPVLRTRGCVVEVDHPEAGRWPQAAVPCHFSRTPVRVTRAAPEKGAHSREVFARLLGMSEADYGRLEAAGVTGIQSFA